MEGEMGGGGFFLFPRFRGRNTGTRAGRVQRPWRRAAHEERRRRARMRVLGWGRRWAVTTSGRRARCGREAEQWQYSRSVGRDSDATR